MAGESEKVALSLYEELAAAALDEMVWAADDFVLAEIGPYAPNVAVIRGAINAALRVLRARLEAEAARAAELPTRTIQYSGTLPYSIPEPVVISDFREMTHAEATAIRALSGGYCAEALAE